MTAPTTARPRARTASMPIDQAPGGANDTRQAIQHTNPTTGSPAGEDSRPTIVNPVPKDDASGGVDDAGRHTIPDNHGLCAASVQPADRQGGSGTHSGCAVGTPGPAAKADPTLSHRSLLDPALSLAADVLDDIERVRIANENRLRQLTRSEEDSDGETRGFGLDDSHPDVARLAAIVATLAKVEHDSTLQLQRQLRRHPLGPWMKAQKGIGEKQGARLLAAIGDPYIRPEIAREDGTVLPAGPRTVSALWAYAGFHCLPVGGQRRNGDHRDLAVDGANFPAGHVSFDAHNAHAGRDQLAARHVDHVAPDPHGWPVYVAARRQRGQKANWSTKAKMRAHLIAESCMKAGGPYREVYDKRKAATEGRTHAAPCAPCGVKGKPAQPGTDWRDGHRHADALRITAKTILRDLWREAKRIHEGAQS